MHRRRALAAAIITVVATALVVAGASQAGAPSKAKKTVKLTANLSGQNEIPPADPNGSGRANVKLKTKKGRACFDIRFEGIGDAIMAHIHKGGPDVNGDIKVPFFEDMQGVSSPAKGCVDVKKGLLKKIAKKPNGWYVNVHTEEFPNGAIRGQ
ncbi:MAG: CHRD domain-containing protein, partial [Solirubrobacterales bacterium]|nr:CHRD domain-containing protein [Solirubrobacterales bacterium]